MIDLVGKIAEPSVLEALVQIDPEGKVCARGWFQLWRNKTTGSQNTIVWSLLGPR